MRTFVLGDLHGGAKALEQVLSRSDFHDFNDHLILLGDLVDGWPETKHCIDILLVLSNVTFVRGNHDQWFIDFLNKGLRWDRAAGWPDIWTSQGGAETLRSYGYLTVDGAYLETGNVPNAHQEFFQNSLQYYEWDNRLFVHGGVVNQSARLGLQPSKDSMFESTWDREMITKSRRATMVGKPLFYPPYDEIYVGHTTITPWGHKTPMKFGNVIAMDTGGGWEGKLSLMDVESGEVWQSDQVMTLYPNARGRHG